MIKNLQDLTERLNGINFSELDDKLDTYIAKLDINPEAYWDGKSVSLRLNKTNKYIIPCYQLNVYIEFLKTEYNIDEEKLRAFNNFLCDGQNHHKLFIYNIENRQLDKSIMYFPINQMKSYFRNILKLD